MNSINKVIKLKKIRWAGHVLRTEAEKCMRKLICTKIYSESLEGYLEGPRRKYEKNIKMELNKYGMRVLIRFNWFGIESRWQFLQAR
jgi:hypothetical protein